MSLVSAARRLGTTVDSLPEELLRDIMLIDSFHLSDWIGRTCPVLFDDDDPADGDLYDVRKKVYLSQVSRRWRRVALGMSRLWSRFRVGLGPPHFSAMIDALLERSGVAPLDVILCMSRPYDPDAESGWYVHSRALYKHIVAALARHSPRIRSLRVYLRGTVELPETLLSKNLDFPALRELRVARDFEDRTFIQGPAKTLHLSLHAPALEILDLSRVDPASVDSGLLQGRITTVSVVGHIGFDFDFDDGGTVVTEQYNLPGNAFRLMAKVFAACPNIQHLEVLNDGGGRILVGPLPDMLRPFSLRSLRNLVLELEAKDLILVLDHLTHVFIPDIRAIVHDPLEFDVATEDGHPLLARLLRGMSPIAVFDISSVQTVTLTDTRGNRRTMGTSEGSFGPPDPEEYWDHAALWEFLCARQGIDKKTRTITVTNRSWLSWANILDSTPLELDELRIADGAWDSIDIHTRGPSGLDMLYYEVYERCAKLEMKPLSFASLRRVVVDNRWPLEIHSGRGGIEYLLDNYVKCASDLTKPIPVCYCDAVLCGNGVEDDSDSTLGNDSEWRFCDRTCYYTNNLRRT